MEPIRRNRDHEDYFTAVFKCPVCGEPVWSCSYGRAWCGEPNYAARPDKCQYCGEKLDWLSQPAEED